MKTNILMALATLMALPAIETVAQTGCPIGTKQDSIVYTQTVSNISGQTLVVNFPQVAASVSTFSGVTLRAWVNSAQSFTLTNFDPEMVPDYSVDVSRSTKFTGNGLNSNIAVNSSTYGPYTLMGSGLAGSSVAVGPDSVFSQTFLTASTYNVTPFTGSGTVSMTYSNKAMTGVNGSNNFSLLVSSNSTVSFIITYYFCSASNLPAVFDDLQVHIADGSAILDWGTRSEEDGMTYRVEAGDDGVHFHGIGTVAGKALNLAKYEYQEPLSATSGKRYYRIVLNYPGGDVKYSMVRMITWGLPPTGLGVYPNPAGMLFTVRFGQPVTGSQEIQLISMTGQILEKHAVLAEKGTSVHVMLNRKYPTGTYIIKAISPDGSTAGLCRIMLAN